MSTELVKPITGKAKEILDGVLLSDETVYVALKGTTGHLIATDQRVIIIKTGLVSGSLIERLSLKSVAKHNSFAYDQISGLQLNKGILSGKIAISTLARATDNTVDFPSTDYGKFKAAKEKIEQLRTARIKSEATSPSIPDQIKKLAELKEQGILTPEEFEAKKSELLNRM